MVVVHVATLVVVEPVECFRILLVSFFEMGISSSFRFRFVDFDIAAHGNNVVGALLLLCLALLLELVVLAIVHEW